MQKRLAELRERLVNDKDIGILAIESAMSPLREMDEEPFPGFTEDVIAEFECVRRELSALDPNQPSQARQFVAIGKRLDFLSRTLSFVVGRWVGKETFCQLEKMDAISQLAGGVAHEFNNILATIVLNAELLEDRLGKENVGKENERVRAVLRVASRGAELTQKMLTFSRQQQLNPRVLDLGILAEGMIGRLMQTLGETIKMEIRQAPDLWPVNADPTQLESAVLNLAGNARDAMPLGGRMAIEMANVTLEPKHAGTQPDLVPGDYVVLAVSDTGHGIEPDVLKRVFDPFFTTKQVGEGCGLGLSMVYGFAKQSGGHVTIDSEVGRGITVTLYLPRAASVA